MDKESILENLQILEDKKFEISGIINKIITEIRKGVGESYKITFGKYEGKTLSEIPRDYLLWLRATGVLCKWENRELREHLDNLYPLSEQEP